MPRYRYEIWRNPAKSRFGSNDIKRRKVGDWEADGEPDQPAKVPDDVLYDKDGNAVEPGMYFEIYRTEIRP